MGPPIRSSPSALVPYTLRYASKTTSRRRSDHMGYYKTAQFNTFSEIYGLNPFCLVRCVCVCGGRGVVRNIIAQLHKQCGIKAYP